MNNPNCGACGMLNNQGFCSLTACRFPVVNELGTWQERILANKPKNTKADSVRSMSDEELACFINEIEAEAIKRAGRYLTKTEIERGKAQRLDWLRQEAEP